MNWLDIIPSEFPLWREGGLMFWPLLVLSIAGLVMLTERTLYLHRGQIRSHEFLAGIKNLLRKRRLIEALTVCEETPGPIASLVKAALLNYDQPETRMRGAVQAAALVEIPLLERRIGSLAAIARIAPLIGLLGTIIALVKSFNGLYAEGAYAHLGAISGGVAEALVSTGGGLAIAIMAHLSYHFLSGRVRAIVHDMEWVGNEVMQFLLRDLPEVPSEDAVPEPAADSLPENGQPATQQSMPYLPLVPPNGKTS